MPGCWLKKGKNEIIVLDLKGPSEAVVKGLKTPVLDILREKERKNRQKGDTLDLSQETPVYKGAFAPVAGWQEVKFTQSAQGQYFCLEALSAQDGKTEATLAELEILGADGKPIPANNGEYAMPIAKKLTGSTLLPTRYTTSKNPPAG